MKSLKIVRTLFIAASMVLAFNSCSKDKNAVKTVSKEQLAGKWNMVVQANSGTVVWHAELKLNGAMEVDQQPYDGIPDVILLWDLTGNNFTAHVDFNNITNYWKLDAPVDPKTLSMAGQFKLNDPATPQTAIFTMDKQ
jgi:hypothetical protein